MTTLDVIMTIVLSVSMGIYIYACYEMTRG